MRIVPDVARLIGEVPTFFDNPSEVVFLRRAVRRTIFRESMDSYDGRERGGWLFGDVTALDDTLIAMATGPGPNAKFARASLQFDLAAVYDVERELREARSSLIRCGSWHTHTNGDAKPSEQDLVHWALQFQELERKIGDDSPAWSGLILTTEDECWSFPEVAAFVMRRDRESRRLVFGRARVSLGAAPMPTPAEEKARDRWLEQL